MNGDFEVELCTQALREDLPSAGDEARLRVRLASAGILAGAGIMTPAATAAATGTATAGVFAKVVALPLAVKLGVSLALAGVAVVPLVHSRLRTLGAPAEVSLPAARLVAAPLLPRTTEARHVEATENAMPSASPAPAEPQRAEASSAVAGEVGTRVSSRAAREVAPARDVGGAPVAPATPNLSGVGAFPVAAATSEDEGTLRAETAVMERALAALQQRDFKTARRELRLHAAQFPNGHLAPERDRALARIRETEKTP